MFSLVVIAVAASVITMYVRHGRFMRRKRLAELAAGAPAETAHTADSAAPKRDEAR